MTKLNEIFVPIKGYEGLYEISNLGQVKSLEKIRLQGNTKSFRTYPEKILIPKNVCGYCQVSLCNNGKIKQVKTHRLVALHFIDNPNNYPIINHKDGNKTNNTTTNLEWCTDSHNSIHAYNTGLRQGMKLGCHPMAKNILNTDTGEKFTTIVEAAKKEGVATSTLSAYFNDFATAMLSTKMKARLSKFIIS